MLKPELKIKFLQHLNRKNNKKDAGFTLIELLVVVIIIGVLAAIALPSLLSQVSKARQTEGKNNIGAVNRAQQSYYLENANKFAATLADLAIGIKDKTENYEYDIDPSADFQWSLNKASSKAIKIKSYAGITYTIKQGTESLTQASLCEAENPLAATGTDTLTGGDDKGDCTKVSAAAGKMKSVK
jgi:type IV pilus assembly protein PilA